MSIKPAGLSMYSRVITTRFAGKCAFCLRPTQPGIDYAAVNASGGWIASCAGCASSLAAQVVALVRTIDATAKGQDVADILAASSMAVPAEANIVAAINGSATEADAYDVMITLMEVRTIIENGLRPRDTLVESLRTIANDASASPRDRTFAASLVQQADKGRTLSDRQREAGVRMLARGNGSQPNVTPVENGLYITTDGKDPASIFKLYTTQNDRQGCKALIVLPNGKGTFEYIKGGTRMVAAKVADGTARKLTQDEATAFGKLHGFCVNCARDLDDERSLAVGYGPVCADNLGWYYPSVSEAAAMLNRPTTIDQVIDEADALGFLDGGE